MTVFSRDVQAYYEDYEGTIRFVCDQYISFCIHKFPNQKGKDVCMLIYREDFHKIELIKESEK
jgi:hypothetical protein